MSLWLNFYSIVIKEHLFKRKFSWKGLFFFQASFLSFSLSLSLSLSHTHTHSLTSRLIVQRCWLGRTINCLGHQERERSSSTNSKNPISYSPIVFELSISDRVRQKSVAARRCVVGSNLSLTRSVAIFCLCRLSYILECDTILLFITWAAAAAVVEATRDGSKWNVSSNLKLKKQKVQNS